MSLRAQNLSLKGRLSGVSAELSRGQITAICGPNGAGKSTLLQMLAGLIPADTGAVMLGDEALSTVPAKTRAQAIGYLAQDAQIAWDVPVHQVVALGRLPYGDNDAEPVDAAITALGLQELAQRRAQSLSGGERARVLLARVLAGEPEWILADEPLAALDLGHQLRLLKHLREAANAGANGGAGVVLVVHDLALAMNHADRVLVLDGGELASEGAPEIALSAEVIERVWGVKAHWIGAGIGNAGANALVIE